MTPQIQYCLKQPVKNITGPLSCDISLGYSNSQTAVLVSPYWKQTINQQGVGYYPTITSFSNTSVTITDNNVASNFYEDIFAINLNGCSAIGSLGAACGMVNKNSLNVQVPLPTYSVTSAFPVVILSPFWSGGTQSVGYNDVVTAVSSQSFTITSQNQATSYNAFYLAIDRGITTTKGLQVEANSINKISPGTMRVYFTKSFQEAPIVLLTPWNDGNTTVLSAPETITNITADYFEFTSTNYGPRYFVNWVAAGALSL